MRILFTFAGGTGHFQPLLPIARAAAARGHDVAFACQNGMLSVVEAAGFSAFDTGGPTLLQSDTRSALPALDADREDRAIRQTFADRVARERATAIIGRAADWRPDLLVHDEVDFGSALAAERLNLPHANVLVIATGSFVRPDLIAEPINRLRGELGLPPDPQLHHLDEYLVLSPFPPSFRHPDFPLPATAQSIQPLVSESDAPPPDWLANLPQPIVYFTLGTIFNLESGNLFERVLSALTQVPARSIVTVGRDLDPAQFGRLPGHIRLERYIPQSAVLPSCSVVVSHAGSGSVMGALRYGLRSVLLPMGADQPHNAMRCEQLGVARVLDAVCATPDDIRDAITAVLSDSACRQSAERLQQEIESLPPVTRAVDLLEELIATRQPGAPERHSR